MLCTVSLERIQWIQEDILGYGQMTQRKFLLEYYMLVELVIAGSSCEASIGMSTRFPKVGRSVIVRRREPLESGERVLIRTGLGFVPAG